MNYSTKRIHAHGLASSTVEGDTGQYTCFCGASVTGGLMEARLELAQHVEEGNGDAVADRKAAIRKDRKGF